MILYHGSKSGINGPIQPNSRSACDFGKGFYLGDKEDQPKSLVAEYKNSLLYTFECDFRGLSVKEFGNSYEEQLDWAMFIAYNRQFIDSDRYPDLCEKYNAYHRSYDVIQGVIANDKMTQALNRFFVGDLCDRALLEALQKVKLGNQYVLKTERACREPYIRLLRRQSLQEKEIRQLKAWNMQRSKQMEGILGQVKTRYRRAQNVRYFDEILQEAADAKRSIMKNDFE